MANVPVNTRLEAALLARLDAWIEHEFKRSGVRLERSWVMRAALEAYLDEREVMLNVSISDN